MTEPLVSIVTIFLNENRFLAEAVESVLAQTYDNWELLLVDDGSTDDGTLLARHFARHHPDRIRYLEHPEHAHRGKSASRNLGIREARGEYVVFLDADDVLFPSKLERQVSRLAEVADAAMVYGRTQYWYSWDSEEHRRDFVAELGVRPDTVYDPPDLARLFITRAGAVPCICAVLVSRERAAAVGGFEESISDLYEDQVFLAKLFIDGRVLVDNECGERYRQHAGSSSYRAISSGEYHPHRPNPARWAFLEWLDVYAGLCGVDDPSFWRPLRRELRRYRNPAWGATARRVGYAIRLLRAGVRQLKSATSFRE